MLWQQNAQKYQKYPSNVAAFCDCKGDNSAFTALGVLAPYLHISRVRTHGRLVRACGRLVRARGRLVRARGRLV